MMLPYLTSLHEARVRTHTSTNNNNNNNNKYKMERKGVYWNNIHTEFKKNQSINVYYIDVRVWTKGWMYEILTQSSLTQTLFSVIELL
jgi:hypothetical protein